MNDNENGAVVAQDTANVDIRRNPVRLTVLISLAQGFMSNPNTSDKRRLPVQWLIEETDRLIAGFGDQCVKESIEQAKAEAAAQAEAHAAGVAANEVDSRAIGGHETPVDTQGNPAIDEEHAGGYHPGNTAPAASTAPQTVETVEERVANAGEDREPEKSDGSDGSGTPLTESQLASLENAGGGGDKTPAEQLGADLQQASDQNGCVPCGTSQEAPESPVTPAAESDTEPSAVAAGVQAGATTTPGASENPSG